MGEKNFTIQSAALFDRSTGNLVMELPVDGANVAEEDPLPTEFAPVCIYPKTVSFTATITGGYARELFVDPSIDGIYRTLYRMGGGSARVVHLAKFAAKKKVRKKNQNRIFLAVIGNK